MSVFKKLSESQQRKISSSKEVVDFSTRLKVCFTSEKKSTEGGEKRSVTGADLCIPSSIVSLLREETSEKSKLLPFIRLEKVRGNARQRIVTTIPEGVWTEMCGVLNSLDFGIREIEVDGYKVGGYVILCKAILDDALPVLLDSFISFTGAALAKALDKAILFGTGQKMPLGICTRLSQEEEPESWKDDFPTWEDLHSTHVLTLNIDSDTGAAFFTALAEALSAAEPVYSADGLFWAMNRKTARHIRAKALLDRIRIDGNEMPIVGGQIVEVDSSLIPDNEIAGGYGGNYLLAERGEVIFDYSDIPFFFQDQTVYKITGRYDGMPSAGGAFVVVRYDNTAPTTTATFAEDTANE